MYTNEAHVGKNTCLLFTGTRGGEWFNLLPQVKEYVKGILPVDSISSRFFSQLVNNLYASRSRLVWMTWRAHLTHNNVNRISTDAIIAESGFKNNNNHYQGLAALRSTDHSNQLIVGETRVEEEPIATNILREIPPGVLPLVVEMVALSMMRPPNAFTIDDPVYDWTYCIKLYPYTFDLYSDDYRNETHSTIPAYFQNQVNKNLKYIDPLGLQKIKEEQSRNS